MGNQECSGLLQEIINYEKRSKNKKGVIVNDDANEKEYTAKVLVTRTYEISFSSPSKEQAKEDVETICQTRVFEEDYTGETHEVLNIVEEGQENKDD